MPEEEFIEQQFGYVKSGETKKNFTLEYYSLRVKKGGTVVNAKVKTRGTLELYKGASATNVTIKRGGGVYVASGGVMNNISWTPCEGNLDIEPGAKVTFTSKHSGVYYGSDGYLISSAKIMVSKNLVGYSSLDSEDSLLDYGEGPLSKLENNGYAEMHVMSGGTAKATTADRSRITIWKGGVADNTSVHRGDLYVCSGGKAINTVIDDGQVTVERGGSVNNLTLSGAYFYVESGTTVNSVSILRGGKMELEEKASATNIDWTPGIGVIHLSAGAKVSFTSKHSGVYYASDQVLLSHAQTMTEKNVNCLNGDYAYMYVMSGGTATDVNVDRGILQVWSGGTATGAAITDNGILYLTDGGRVCDTEITGTFYAEGGTASNTTINGGWMDVNSGCVANGIVINGDGDGGRHCLSVQSGGIATNITVSRDYDEYELEADSSTKSSNYDDHFSFYDVAAMNCQILVESGGIATNIQLGPGCILCVAKGGKVGNVTKAPGARIIAQTGANLNYKYVVKEVSPDADEGWNGWLYKKKKANTFLTESTGVKLSEADPSIRVDEASPGKDGWDNFAGYGDDTDIVKAELEKGAKVSFTVTASGATKFTVYSLTPGKTAGTYTMKTLLTKKLRKTTKDGVVIYTGTTDALLLNRSGIKGTEYYISVQSTDAKKGGATYYNVFLNTEDGKNRSYFYSDGDNGWNNGPLLVKNGKVKVPDLTQIAALKVADIPASDTRAVVFDDTKPAATDANPVDGGWDNFVGFGDDTDYAKLDLTQPSKLDFTIESTGNVKLVICKVTQNSKGKWSQTEVKTLTVSLKEEENDTCATRSVTILLDRLAAGAAGSGYYVSVRSTNAKKGGQAWYNVSVESTVYPSDFGANNKLFSDKKNKELNANLKGSAVYANGMDVDFTMETGDVDAERYIDGTAYGSFVGFGDEIDFAGVEFKDTGICTFTVETSGTTNGAVKFILCKLTRKSNGVWTEKSLGSFTVRNDEAEYGTGMNGKDFRITDVSGENVKYFVSVQASGSEAKKGGMHYNVTASMSSLYGTAALAMPETECPAGPDIRDSLFAGPDSAQDASLASPLLDPVSEKFPGESANGLLAI